MKIFLLQIPEKSIQQNKFVDTPLFKK